MEENQRLTGREVENLSQEKSAALSRLFAEMGVKPKMGTKEDLQSWMADYAASQRLGRAAPGFSNVTPSVGTVTGRKPWLVKFTGDHTSEGYDLWRHQLSSLMKEGHSRKDLADAVRSSLSRQGRQHTCATWNGNDGARYSEQDE